MKKGYELSRDFFDWCFENPEKISPNHIALYFFIVEHCNRLGWKEKFGLPTTMAKEAIGIRSYNTYIKTLNDLVNFGFITLIEKSKNQYSSNIVALSIFNKALDKALDKALIKHTTKQSESTQQSIDSINKQLTINNKQLTSEILIDSEKINSKDFFYMNNEIINLTPFAYIEKNLLSWLESVLMKFQISKENAEKLFLSKNFGTFEDIKHLRNSFENVIKNNHTPPPPKKKALTLEEKDNLFGGKNPNYVEPNHLFR